ncbi:hypothetical protein OG488_21145 [Streptomyces sp. NBC_01460]|uniref:hypothetical protein n=1 Tax=Streptomyces sp. NBC_01460 TaxID=2903875 RepID=UPI002E2ED93E|nr:hypothetical protein [Streptomyces sp. NBC_01460]
MTDPQGPPPPPVPEPRRPDPPPSAPDSVLRQLVRSQAGNRRGNATGYLRGAAHLDRRFRNAVIKELGENPHRIPPPSYGMDLAAVFKECLVARREVATRAAILLALPLLMLPVSTAGALVPLLLVLSVRVANTLGNRLKAAREERERSDGDRRPGPGRGAVTLLLLFFLVWALWNAINLSGTALHQQSGDVDVGSRHLLTALLVLVGWIAVASVYRYRTEHHLYFLAIGRAQVHPDPPAAEARLEEIRRQQADPDVVYSDYAPFVGAGIELDHWSFAIELVPDPDRKSSAVAERRAAFNVPEVHARIRRDLLRFGEGDAYPGDRLRGLQVDDSVMKSGKRLGPASEWSVTGSDSQFQEKADEASAEAARMLRTQQDGRAPETWWADSLDMFAEERLRHYLTVRVGSWDDEVVLTVFSRVQMQGGLLFLESRAFLLPPIAQAYHLIDDILPPKNTRDWAELVGAALASAVSLVADAPGDLAAPSRTKTLTARSKQWYERMCRTDRPVDHGPAYSIREIAAEPRFQQLFQEMDVRRFLKSIQTRTVTAVRNSLSDAGYRTSEYDARTTVLFDRSVHVNGTVHGNVQTGDHARASHRTVTTPQPHVGPPGGGTTTGSS